MAANFRGKRACYDLQRHYQQGEMTIPAKRPARDGTT